MEAVLPPKRLFPIATLHGATPREQKLLTYKQFVSYAFACLDQLLPV